MQQTTTYPDPTTPQSLRSLRVGFRLFVMVAMPILLVISAFTLFMDDPVAVADELGPEAPGSIAGVVKDRNGALLAAIEVSLYRQSSYASDDWSIIRTTTTQADGKYRFTVLPVGNYRISVSDPKGRYATIFYPTAPTVDKATVLTVVGNQINNIDLILYPGGLIRGVITGTTTFSLTTATVLLHQEWKRQGISYWAVLQSVPVARSSGAYTFTNLSADSYRICAGGSNATSTTYECYDNVYDITRAMPITLTASATVSNVNFILGDGADYGQIRGRVTSLRNEPLSNIEVTALRESEQPFVYSTYALASRSRGGGGDLPYPGYGYPYAYTDSQGNYVFANVSAGNYRLLFRDPTGNYAFEYYNDSVVPEGAALITLADRQNLSVPDVQLAPGNHIRGSVTIAEQPAPISFMRVEIKTPLGWQFAMNNQNVASDGLYAIGGLPAGVYRVWTTATIADLNTTYFYQGYHVTPGAVDPSGDPSFTAISLTGGETKIANIALSGGPQFAGSLSGRVTAVGAPLAGAKVMLLYPQNSSCCPVQWQPLVSVFTDANGRYTVNGLASTALYVGATDPTGLYATTYYTAYTTPTTANLIYVEDGQVRNNIDVNLPLAGAISGRVTQPDGRPVADLLVTISMLTQPYNAFIAIQLPLPEIIRTAADGRYIVKGLHPGEYNICLQDTQRGFNKCYGMLQGVFDPTAGRVSVRTGVTTTDIDVRWGPDLKNYLPIIAR